jgi:hypothetical protein
MPLVEILSKRLYRKAITARLIEQVNALCLR